MPQRGKMHDDGVGSIVYALSPILVNRPILLLYSKCCEILMFSSVISLNSSLLMVKKKDGIIPLLHPPEEKDKGR